MIFRNMFSLVTLAAGVLLCGCIEVADMGDSWGKGTLDPALEGRWLMKADEDLPKQGDKEEFYVFTAQGDQYRVIKEDDEGEDDEAFIVKTLQVGDTKFMMLKDEPRPNVKLDNSGDLWPYRVNDQGIEFIRLTKASEEKVKTLAGGLLAPGYNDDHVTQYKLVKLDAAALTALEKLTADPSLWEVWATGVKSPP